MFRVISKAIGEEIEFVKPAAFAPFAPLRQYLCKSKDGKNYVALLSDSALSDFYFDRAYESAKLSKEIIQAAAAPFCGFAGGYRFAVIELDGDESDPDFSSYYGGEPSALTDRLRDQSINELLGAYPAEFKSEIVALDSFNAYKNALDALESAVLVTEYGTVKQGWIRQKGGVAAVLNGWYARALQPAGYDMMTYGMAGAPNTELNQIKKSLLADISAIVSAATKPQVVGDADACLGSPTPQSDFIYNRFDYMYGHGRTITVREWNRDVSVSVNVAGVNASLGLWLVTISEAAEKTLCEYIFEHYKSVKRIRYRYAFQPLGRASLTNHYHIVIPKSSDELYASLSQHARYDVRHKKRIAESELGGYTVKRMEKKEVPAELVEAYYDYKKKTYDVPYEMPASEYLDAYHVTHVYQLDTADKKMAALLFSCEQGQQLYLENLTYDTEFKRYSLGQTLYDYFLNDMIKLGKSRLYLGGGSYEYKTRFGSVETIVYTGELWRNGFYMVIIKAGSKLRGGMNRIKKLFKK